MQKKTSGLNQSVNNICGGGNAMRRNTLSLLCLTSCGTCLTMLAVLAAASHAYGGEALPKPEFKQTQGQGLAVCEAYLQRLNATEFLDNDPTKGWVNEPLLEGFADLKPVPLTAQEIQRLYYKIKSFEQYQDQNLLEKYNALHKDDGRVKNQAQRLRWLIEQPNDRLPPPFVRYQTKLDLDNDGIATDIVIKGSKREYVGDRYIYGSYIDGTFIVDSSLQQIQEAHMKRIFADQEILDWPSVILFPPLASSIDVFSFNGKTYFDGFQDVILELGYSPGANRSVPVSVAVFIHENYRTQKICTFQWVNGKVYPLIRDTYDK